MKKIYYVKCEYSEKLTDFYCYEIDNEIIQEDNLQYTVIHKLLGMKLILKNDVLTFSDFKEFYYKNKEISGINYWDDENKRHESFHIGFIYENEEDADEMKRYAKKLVTKSYEIEVKNAIEELQHCLSSVEK